MQMKDTLLTNIDQLLKEIPQGQIYEKLLHLKLDMEKDVLTMMVVGEFNSGKSTFVNALLQQALLPTGIIPTTATINSCYYSEIGDIHIHYQDGHISQIPYSAEHLKQYVAQEDRAVENIDYIAVGTPTPFLKNQIILIDTPGLNDVNQLRSDITHQMIPRADVVLFLVNSTQAFKKSEVQFIEENLLHESHDRILFIANHIDDFENEEEIEEKVQHLQLQLAQQFQLSQSTVIPLCAIEALEGYEKNDEELIEMSNIREVQRHIDYISSKGSRKDLQLQNYKLRLLNIIEEYEMTLKHKVQLQKKTSEQLKNEINMLSSLHIDEQKKQYIHQYMQQYALEIENIVYKSVDYFYGQIEEDGIMQIQMYGGQQIGEYLQQQLSFMLKKQLKQWIDRYSSQIQILFTNLQKGLSTGLSAAFEENIQITVPVSFYECPSFKLNLAPITQKNTTMNAGLIVGGASALLMSLGAPILIPVIGMAGLPYLRENMHLQQLTSLKPRIIADFENELYQHKMLFKESLSAYIKQNIIEIENYAIQQFNDMCNISRQQITEQQQQHLEQHSLLTEKVGG